MLGSLTANHGGAICEAAVAGLGVAKLPDFLVARALAAGRLVRLLDAYALPPSGIHLLYPSGAAPLPKVDVFVKEVGAALRARLDALHQDGAANTVDKARTRQSA